MTPPVVALDSVSVTYRDAPHAALEDASLVVYPGEVVLVAGPSGCGKSTLLRVVNGLVPRSYRATVAGSVQVAGEDITDKSIRDISETVGTLLQDPARQVVGHTLLAELAFGLENRGCARGEIRARAEAVAKLLGIFHLLDEAPHNLSGGQLQLVAFAGILILEPRVILVDEPLANLDPDAADVLLSAVRRYVDNGGAAILVEHRVDEALVLRPDRVLYLEEGRVAYDGDVSGFLAAASPDTVKLPFASLCERDDLPTRSSIPFREPDTAGVARLHFDGTDLGYPNRTVLSAVHRKLFAGQNVAILGRNGAGKTTLMRAAVGLIEPQAGAVFINGRTLTSLDARELVADIGYLFQNPAQAFFSDTVAAELAFGPRNIGVAADEIDAVARQALAAVALDEVDDILQRPPRTLSFGQQRRLALALALTLSPRTLVLDEPTAGQDERSTRHFLDAVWSIGSVDSVYFITHDIDMALSRADRVIVVDCGGIVADGSPREVLADRALWHPAGVSPSERAVLRETDYVRAARSCLSLLGEGPLPDPVALAAHISWPLVAPPMEDVDAVTQDATSVKPLTTDDETDIAPATSDIESADMNNVAPPRPPLWAVTSRTIVFGAIGAALYGVLGVFSFILPGTGNVAIRPAIALIPFVGARFGPIAGFFTGAIGNAIVDQVQGAGFLTYWNWSLANGLAGLVAGLLAHIFREPNKSRMQIIRIAGIAAVSSVVGMLLTVTDVFLLGATPGYWFYLEYIPAVLATALAGIIIAPVLDRAWKPLQNLAGR